MKAATGSTGFAENRNRCPAKPVACPFGSKALESQLAIHGVLVGGGRGGGGLGGQVGKLLKWRPTKGPRNGVDIMYKKRGGGGTGCPLQKLKECSGGVPLLELPQKGNGGHPAIWWGFMSKPPQTVKPELKLAHGRSAFL